MMAPPIDVNKYEHLKASGDLPSPKGVALAIIRLIQQEDCTVGALERVIKTDPAFVGRLLKAANSLPGFDRRAVVSVNIALMVLGLPAVRTLALGFSLLSQYGGGACKSFNYRRYWSACLVQAVAMQAITQRTRAAAVEEMFCLGLLARVGELALSTLYPQEYAKILTRTLELCDVPLLKLEQRAFAMTHRELGAAMLADWGLPKIFCEAAACAEDPGAAGSAPGTREHVLSHSLLLAAHISEMFLAPLEARPALMRRVQDVGAILSFEVDAIYDLCDGIACEWHAWGLELSLETTELVPFRELGAVSEAPAPGASALALAQPAERPDPRGLISELDLGGSAPLRVLIVDEDRAMRTQMRSVLEAARHFVVEVPDGPSGLEKALEFEPQLMFISWGMAEMDGLALTRALRQTKIGRSIYILILTVEADDARLIEAFESGVDDFMHKPVGTQVLAARLRAGQRVIRLQQELERDREDVRRFAAELAVSNRRLQEVALTDALTGFPNRRYAIERINQEWSVSSRTRRPLSVMVIDVDQFKRCNDSYGHDIGDAILCQVSASVKDALRAQDIVARTGGDEFLVICPDTGLDAALACAERVRFAADSAYRVELGGELRISVSIGVATRSAAMADPDALIKRADQALYLAKNKGRNRIMSAQSLRSGPSAVPAGRGDV